MILKSMGKRNKIDAIMVARAKKTAELTGYSYRYIRYVIECERNSDKVMQVYMTLQEEEEEVFKRLMTQQINKMVPIPRPYPLKGRKEAKADKKQGESTQKRTEKAENP
jgi:hypothetical protein